MRQQALWYDTSRVKHRRRGEVFMGSTGAPLFWPEESSRGKFVPLLVVMARVPALQ